MWLDVCDISKNWKLNDCRNPYRNSGYMCRSCCVAFSPPPPPLLPFPPRRAELMSHIPMRRRKEKRRRRLVGSDSRIRQFPRLFSPLPPSPRCLIFLFSRREESHIRQRTVQTCGDKASCFFAPGGSNKDKWPLAQVVRISFGGTRQA